ncbi:hypothetical protein FWD20_03195 [Candidatus Saccharibacteria bacterium]|nr:hypothetical protein [Candidatus Saccharibacteria bacterium]
MNLTDFTTRCRLQARARFLEATRAIQTPPQVYATWLAIWHLQGNRINNANFADRPYNKNAMCMGERPPIDLSIQPYDDPRYMHWMPTTWPEGTRVPIECGALALSGLMIVEDWLLPHLDLSDLPGPTRPPGACHGHASATIIKRGRDPSDPFGLKAKTNRNKADKKSGMDTYLDTDFKHWLSRLLMAKHRSDNGVIDLTDLWNITLPDPE